MPKIRLYDGNYITLKKLHTLKERWQFVQENVFNKKINQEDSDLKTYGDYYNVFNDKYNEKDNEQKVLIDRWLGYKIVGKPEPQEHTKAMMNFLTTYLLNAKDYSCNKAINTYLKLNKKINNGLELSDDETSEYNHIKGRIIFHKKNNKGKDIIFYVNTEMEDLLKLRIQELKNKKYKDYTEFYMIKNLEDRLNICKESVNKCLINNKKIEQNKDEIEKIYNLIKQEYEIMKDLKDKSNIKYIEKLCKKLKSLEDENKYLIKENINLRDDYYIATEYIYNSK